MWQAFKRWFGAARLPQAQTAPSITATPAPAAAVPEAYFSGPRVALPFIQIEEVADAAPYAGALFQKKFGHPIPDYPIHYVAFYQPLNGERKAVAYVHYLAHENTFLCGGMCVDTGVYREMRRDSIDRLELVGEAGGLAEHLLRTTFEMLGPCAAIFGSVGDATARVVDLRAGFVDTGETHVMVVWRDARDASDAEKTALIKKIAALGTF